MKSNNMNMLTNYWLRELLPTTFRKSYVTAFDNCLEKITCMRNDEFKVEGEMGMAVPPFVSKFNKVELDGHLLAIADEDGRIQLINSMKSGRDSILKEWCAHSNAVFDVAWIEGKSQLVTASADHTARLWDIEKAETIAMFRGHTCSLKTVTVQPGSYHVFSTGARDGNIMTWDTRCQMRNGYYSSVNTICNAHGTAHKQAQPATRRRGNRRPSMSSTDSRQSVTSVVFQQDNVIISSGACDGVLKMWDLRRNYSSFKGEPLPMHTMSHAAKSAPRQHGYSCLTLDSTSLQLFATCTNNITYSYNLSTLPTSPLAEYHGGVVSTFYIKSAVSPNNMYFLCGSSDSNAYIWNINQPDKAPWMLQGHTAEVTSLDWCPADINKIVTCADDNSFRIWRNGRSDKENQANTIAGVCKRAKDGINQPSANEKTQTNSSRQTRELKSQLITNLRCLLQKPSLKYTNLLQPAKQPSTPSPASPTTPKLFKACMRDVSNLVPSPEATPRLTLVASRMQSPLTPRSSRRLMETWLGSPSASPITTTVSSPEANENSHPQRRRTLKARRIVTNIAKKTYSQTKVTAHRLSSKRKHDDTSDSPPTKSSRRRLDCSSP